MRPTFLGTLIMLGVIPSAATAAPAITLDPPVVQGNAVSLSAALTANGSCGAGSNNLVGCYANYTFSGGGGTRTFANLWWNDFPGVQPIPQDFNLVSFPADTYSVSLVATDSRGAKYSSNTQQFTWPAGRLAVEGVALTGEPKPRVSYRVTYGKTSFTSAEAKIAFSTPSGRRIASFRRCADPGLNLEAVPSELRARLEDDRRYVVRIQVEDQYERTAKARTTVTR
jgi:hypothetical protein